MIPIGIPPLSRDIVKISTDTLTEYTHQTSVIFCPSVRNTCSANPAISLSEWIIAHWHSDHNNSKIEHRLCAMPDQQNLSQWLKSQEALLITDSVVELLKAYSLRWLQYLLWPTNKLAICGSLVVTDSKTQWLTTIPSGRSSEPMQTVVPFDSLSSFSFSLHSKAMDKDFKEVKSSKGSRTADSQYEAPSLELTNKYSALRSH